MDERGVEARPASQMSRPVDRDLGVVQTGDPGAQASEGQGVETDVALHVKQVCGFEVTDRHPDLGQLTGGEGRRAAEEGLRVVVLVLTMETCELIPERAVEIRGVSVHAFRTHAELLTPAGGDAHPRSMLRSLAPPSVRSLAWGRMSSDARDARPRRGRWSLLRPASLRSAVDDFYGEGHSAILPEERVKDRTALSRLEDEAIREVVRRQIDLGLDVVTDGEFRRWMFLTSFYDAVERFRTDNVVTFQNARGGRAAPRARDRRMPTPRRLAGCAGSSVRDRGRRPYPFKLTFPAASIFVHAFSYEPGIISGYDSLGALVAHARVRVKPDSPDS